ncbi:hypothetical protein HDU96_002369 [Phlyctochytrium bullatum]|nr:hypothetical protein HDU96_002369 [Phlyctochytrium bullatum]
MRDISADAESSFRRTIWEKEKELSDLQRELLATKEESFKAENRAAKRIMEKSKADAEKNAMEKDKVLRRRPLNLLSKLLITMETREEELVSTIRKLSAVAEEQKRKIMDLEDYREEALKMIHEKQSELQDKLRVVKSKEDHIRSLEERLSTLNVDLSKEKAKSEESEKAMQKILIETTEKLEEAEESIESLSQERDVLRTEKGNLESSYRDIQGKLKLRNESIAQIEAEVEKVKSAFKRKEEKLLQENDILLRKVQQLDQEIRRLNERAREMVVFQNERTTLLESIRSMEKDVQSVDSLKSRHKEETSLLLKEIEKQRLKFSRLKEALDESQ